MGNSVLLISNIFTINILDAVKVDNQKILIFFIKDLSRYTKVDYFEHHDVYLIVSLVSLSSEMNPLLWSKIFREGFWLLLGIGIFKTFY